MPARSRKDVDAINFLYSIIGTPLGYILYFIYNFICKNVGIAILLFTFIIKLAMLPLSIKQQKSTAKSAIFQPKIKEIQQKYKNNQQKMQEEMMKLQQQGFSPYSGCGTMLLTFLLLFGVLDVVYKPMTHIEHTNAQKIEEFIEESYRVELTSVFVKEASLTEEQLSELKEDELKKHEQVMFDLDKIVKYYNENVAENGESVDIGVFKTLDENSKDVLCGVMETAALKAHAEDEGIVLFTDTDLYKLTSAESDELGKFTDNAEKDKYKAEHAFSDRTRELMTTVQGHFGGYRVVKENDESVYKFQGSAALQRELYALECFGTGDNKHAYDPGIVGEEFKAELTELYDNLNFLGIKLGQVPWEHMGFPMILVPITSFIMSLLQMFISNRMMAKNNPDAAQGMGAMKITMYIMPLFSLWLAFTIPAGAGFYWTISYVFGIIQTIILNKLYSPDKLRAQAEAEYAAKMKVIEAEASRIRDTDNDNSIHEYKGEKLTQKEINRRKLAEARRQDAIKYGEDYDEDKDD